MGTDEHGFTEANEGNEEPRRVEKWRQRQVRKVGDMK